MDYYILQTFLLVITLLFIIAIVCYHYTKHRSGKKTYWPSNNIKMENDELKKIVLKIVRVIISMTSEVEDSDFDNILLDEKSWENILIYYISYKTLIDAKFMFDKVEGFIRD